MRRTHFIYAAPLLGPAVLPLLLNLCVIAVLLVHLKAVRSQMMVSFASAPPAIAPDSGPHVQISRLGILLGDAKVASVEELDVQMQRRTWRSASARVTVEQGVPTETLTEVLRVLGRVGLNRVRVETLR